MVENSTMQPPDGLKTEIQQISTTLTAIRALFQPHPQPREGVAAIIPWIAGTLALLALVGGLTYHLILESAIAYQRTQASPRTFAVLIEAGIVCLSIYSPRGLFRWISAKAILASLVLYSLAVLSVGIQTRSGTELAGISATARRTEILERDIATKEIALSKLVASSYLGASRKLSSQLDSLKTELRQELAKPTLPKPTIENETTLLIAGRALLLCLNILCSHLLARCGGGIWGWIRSSLLVRQSGLGHAHSLCLR